VTELLGYSAPQVRAAEVPYLDAGVPLMQRAATALAAVVREHLPGDARVLALVGPGNNGGDALFAAAELAADGVDVSLLSVVPGKWHEEGLAAAVRAGARVVEFEDEGFAALAETSDLVLDGMFGTGSAGRESVALRGAARAAVEILLRLPGGRRPVVIAVDIPSGIDADSGAVPDPVVLPADVTVTFGGVKAGLLLPPADALAGEIRLIDIGIRPQLEQNEPVVRRDLPVHDQPASRIH
jgi:NAD(P)H-hydrate epimerase